MNAPQYLFDVSSKPSLPWHEVPLIRATNTALQGYGYLVEDPDCCEIEITRWPQQGWRPIDSGTGNEGGWVEGTFCCHWQGDVLYGENAAVAGNYVLGWTADPATASKDCQTVPRSQVLLWHMNYHPDGGQLFYPLDDKPFVVPLALPGDNLTPDKVVAFWCDASHGLYIHAGVWHEGIFPLAQSQRFLDRQGRVHARVSADIGQEFGVYLACPLDPGKIKDL
ncbi:ureidoglycolate lyase [Marinobacterium rhizophilum]|uniref:Ureidoglycolate lyase n=1 Tax=Marinobacterium rhizophilum TaxID=420402 RepID=A0ABY5HR21_9GAMM|nr:ureidoglycolate lyase [Marinobacterium rhizophilum]UTW13667.1 ureidoglycolate lyase [Marinobacterium rhizophilum]